MNTKHQSTELCIPGAFKNMAKLDALLNAIRQAADHAEEDCAGVERTLHWLMLIEASVGHAQTMLHEMLDDAYAEISKHNAAQRQLNN